MILLPPWVSDESFLLGKLIFSVLLKLNSPNIDDVASQYDIKSFLLCLL